VETTSDGGFAGGGRHEAALLRHPGTAEILLLGGGQLSAGGGCDCVFDTVYASADLGETWTQRASPGWPARAGLAAAVFNDKVWVFGGRGDSTGNVVYNDVWLTANAGGSWLQMVATAAWSARFGHRVVAFEDELLLIGGQTAYTIASTSREVWASSDGVFWNSLSDAPFAGRRNFGAVVTSMGEVWVFGGKASSGEKNDVWASADRGNTWTERTDAAGWSVRESFPAVITGGDALHGLAPRAFLHGGLTSGTQYDDCWYAETGCVENPGSEWVQVSCGGMSTDVLSHVMG
jgi:hypothetical protein